MPSDQAFALSNARAFIKSIQEMTPKQKEDQPLGQYGDNFNRLLEQAKKSAPQVSDVHWPTSIEVYDAAMHRGRFTRSTFAEISTYARQIEGLLLSVRD